jgi:hypothetical protein
MKVLFPTPVIPMTAITVSPGVGTAIILIFRQGSKSDLGEGEFSNFLPTFCGYIYPCIGAMRFEGVKSTFFSLMPNSLVATSALSQIFVFLILAREYSQSKAA